MEEASSRGGCPRRRGGPRPPQRLGSAALGECCKSRRQHRTGARRPWGTRGAGTVGAAKGDFCSILLGAPPATTDNPSTLDLRDFG